MADLCVVNASPLIFLGAANRLSMLRGVATRVFVPEPVMKEVAAHGLSDPAVVAVTAATWIETVAPVSHVPAVLAWDLGPGESAVICLALTHSGAIAVLDDLQARRCAESLGVPVAGTLGIILSAKKRGEIPLARPLLNELRSRGMWLSDRILETILHEVGE